MPLLKNHRHEAFAQAKARGMSGSAAYRKTYGTNSKNVNDLAAQLSAKLSIQKRIDELQQMAEHATLLSIEDKRIFYAKTMNNPFAEMRDRLKASSLDSELAGHVKMASGVEVNLHVAMLTEDRREAMMQRKREAVARRKNRLVVPLNGTAGRN